jgi:hypothetical protein
VLDGLKNAGNVAQRATAIRFSGLAPENWACEQFWISRRLLREPEEHLRAGNGIGHKFCSLMTACPVIKLAFQAIGETSLRLSVFRAVAVITDLVDSGTTGKNGGTLLPVDSFDTGCVG